MKQYIQYDNKDKNASISYSVLEKLDKDNNKFKYISSINNDNSQALIFNLSSFKIIVIHIKNENNNNLGLFINQLIKPY